MVLDREWLLGVARMEREALGRSIQYANPDLWENPSPWRGRPAADILCHLAADEIASAALLGGEEPTEMEEWRKSVPDEDASPDVWIEWSTARRLQQHPLRTALEWGRAAELVLARASKLSTQDWRDRQVRWTAGDLRAGYFVQARVVQWWLHGQDILQGTRQALRREHPPTYVVNDFAVRLIPYALSLEGHSFPGRCVHVELDQVGEGVWLQGLEAGYLPDRDLDPDVVITGHGPWFALLATRRVEAEQVLYEGTVNIGGDVGMGEAILRSLRAFP